MNSIDELVMSKIWGDRMQWSNRLSRFSIWSNDVVIAAKRLGRSGHEVKTLHLLRSGESRPAVVRSRGSAVAQSRGSAVVQRLGTGCRTDAQRCSRATVQRLRTFHGYPDKTS